MRRALKGQTLAGLINNAGIANHAVLMHQPIEEFRRVMEVNLVGTLAVTQASTFLYILLTRLLRIPARASTRLTPGISHESLLCSNTFGGSRIFAAPPVMYGPK